MVHGWVMDALVSNETDLGKKLPEDDAAITRKNDDTTVKNQIELVKSTWSVPRIVIPLARIYRRSSTNRNGWSDCVLLSFRTCWSSWRRSFTRCNGWWNCCYFLVFWLRRISSSLRSNRIKILVTSFECASPMLIINDRGCWWRKRLKPSQTSIIEMSPTQVVSNNRYQHRCKRKIRTITRQGQVTDSAVRKRLAPGFWPNSWTLIVVKQRVVAAELVFDWSGKMWLRNHWYEHYMKPEKNR